MVGEFCRQNLPSGQISSPADDVSRSNTAFKDKGAVGVQSMENGGDSGDDDGLHQPPD